MTKKQGKKPPSRQRYEQTHRVRSCRLNKEEDDILEEKLTLSGRTFGDFVRDHIKEERAMVDKRVNMIASKLKGPSDEERLRSLENLVYEIFSITVDTQKYPPFCPHCDDQELFQCEGKETESKIAHPWVRTWKCQKCGFFINTYKRIDPKSIKWIDPDSGGYIDKPRTSKRHWLK